MFVPNPDPQELPGTATALVDGQGIRHRRKLGALLTLCCCAYKRRAPGKCAIVSLPLHSAASIAGVTRPNVCLRPEHSPVLPASTSLCPPYLQLSSSWQPRRRERSCVGLPGTQTPGLAHTQCLLPCTVLHHCRCHVAYRTQPPPPAPAQLSQMMKHWAR
jgi:hypothetical protein